MHVFEVNTTGQKDSWNYKLTSTVLVSMPMKIKGLGDIDLFGSVTKQAQKQQHYNHMLIINNHI